MNPSADIAQQLEQKIFNENVEIINENLYSEIELVFTFLDAFALTFTLIDINCFAVINHFFNIKNSSLSKFLIMLISIPI